MVDPLWQRVERELQRTPTHRTGIGYDIARIAVQPRRRLRLAVRAFAAAATVAALFFAARAARPADSPRPVQFVLVAERAERVALVGDFNDWDPRATPLESRDGIWTVELPLAAGRHTYAFVVDNETWVADPSAPRESAAFDAPASVILVNGT